jgi:hypothetical protein
MGKSLPDATGCVESNNFYRGSSSGIGSVGQEKGGGDIDASQTGAARSINQSNGWHAFIVFGNIFRFNMGTDISISDRRASANAVDALTLDCGVLAVIEEAGRGIERVLLRDGRIVDLCKSNFVPAISGNKESFTFPARSTS